MLELLTVFAAAEEESSKTLFYVLGGVAAVYAVLVAAFGIRQPDFPRDGGQARAVYIASIAVVALAMASAIITS